MAAYHYHQYGDLPQIPSISEDSQYNLWSNHPSGYRQASFRVEDDFDYGGLDHSGGLGVQRVERFLTDASPLTAGVLHAKFEHGMPSSQRYGIYEQWPTPDLNRYDSPDRTSVTSSYVTQNEVRSPHPFHSSPYGNPEESTQMAFVYPGADHLKSELPLPGGSLGSISLREIEYEHDPEPEPTVEDAAEAIEVKTDPVFQQDTSYLKAAPVSNDYRTYSDSGISSSLRDAESVQPMEPSEEDSSDLDYSPKSGGRRRSSASNSNSGSSRNSQRRRSHHFRKNSATSTPTTNRIGKRAGRTNASANKGSEACANGDGQRHFPCPLAPYGCRSTFSSKNEWKRHVGTQHIKLGFWRCNLCPTTVDPNDDQVIYHNEFNRKDLFTQHLRRMHSEPPKQSPRTQRDYPVTEENITEHQQLCFMKLRDNPTQSSCLYCDETFKGLKSWDLRMEHIGRHLEKDRKAGHSIGDAANWNIDKDLEQWLLEEGIIAFQNGKWKIGDGKPQRLTLGMEDEDSEVDT